MDTNTTRPGGWLARLVSIIFMALSVFLTVYVFLIYLGQGNAGRLFAGVLPAISAAAGGQTASGGLLIVGRDILYEQTSVTTAADKPTHVTFRNGGALQHSLIFDLGAPNSPTDDFGVPAEWPAGVGIQGGTTTALELPALPAGTYRYYCNVPGHAAVMHGVLTVQ